jgi:hypothetical protein
MLLGAFLAFSSLSAGSGKRTRKPLGAHQENYLIPNEREHGCCDLQPNYASYIGNSTSIRSLYINASFHHLRRFTHIIRFTLYFVPRDKKNLAPNKRTILLAKRRNSKMEDRLHVHQIWAKQ